MSKKIETVLRIVAIVSLIVGAWALALNQFSQFIENGKEAELASYASECARFKAPHAIIDPAGEVYCYGIFAGSEKLAPLNYLRSLLAEEPIEEQAGEE